MKPDPNAFRLGDARGGSAPAVLCVHGLTGTPYEVRPPAEALAEAGFYCEGLLLPGHGTHVEDLSATRHAAWVEAVVSAHDALSARHERVYALGLSLGGVLTLALAQRRTLAGAVVMAAPLRLPGTVRSTVPLLARVLGSLPKTPGILDPEAREVHPGYDRMPLRAVHELLRLSRQVRAGLGGIRTPIQAIYSRRDPTVPASNAELLMRGLPAGGHELHWLEDSGHVLPVDRERALVARRVVDFLQKLEGART